MPLESPNPYAYAFPAVLLIFALLYYLYGAVDRMGLETQVAEVRVTGKQFAAGSTTYHTNVIDGRTITQAQRNPDTYMIAFELEGEPTGGLVSQQLYESLEPGERVRVRFRRTRFSGRIVVTDVSR